MLYSEVIEAPEKQEVPTMVKNTSLRQHVIFVVALSMSVLSARAADVAISGFVKTQDGKAISGAIISLFKENLAATTNADGSYSLSGNLPVRLLQRTSQQSGSPWLDRRGVGFSVAADNSQVRVRAFDMQGKLVATLLDRSLNAGSYFVNPFSGLKSGLYFVSVRIAGEETVLRMPLVNNRARTVVLQREGYGKPSLSMHKSTASADTLSARAAGYTTVCQGIPSYTGSYDFTLSPDSSLTYYRLRIEYLNASDWSTVTFQDPAKIIKTRIMSSAGNPIIIGANNNQLSLNQTYAAGDTTRMTVDCALLPSALDTPFTMTMQKGGAGRIILRIYTVVGTTVQLVKEVNESGQLTFSIDLSSLKTSVPWQAPMASVGKMGLALYYPWYYMGSWTSNELIDHPATLYDSGDTLAIARQMDQAKSAGITGFLESWAGPGSDSDNKLKLLLKVAQQKGFKIGIFFELLDDNGARNADTVFNWLYYLVSTYRNNPSILTFKGKPITVPFCTQLFGYGTWKKTLDRLHAAGLDPSLVADRDAGDSLSIVDGACCSPSNSLGLTLRYYSVLADSPAAKIYIATAMPGFDERLIPGRTGRYTDRQNGQYYTTQLQAAFNSNPNWFEAYTWNEWWENTYIEPSVNFGDQYLQITASYLKQWEIR
jgi:Glycosyl hydrolase family 99